MIGTIIVGYQNETLTATYVRQELSKLTVDNLIVVVDNSPTTSGSRYLQEQLGAHVVDASFSGFEPGHQVYVVAARENLGFAKANNLGVTFLQKFFPEIEYVLFSNNDIQIVDANVVEVLIQTYASVEGIGIITPNILCVDGTRQTPMPKCSLWRSLGSDLLYYLTHHHLDAGESYCETAQEGFHYTFSECFFISRIIDYVACGMMDSHTFLYAEGNILSERMSWIGLGCYFVPRVTVIHDNGSTTRQHIGSDVSLLMARSNAYYFHTYRGYSFFSVWLYVLTAKIMSWLSKAKRSHFLLRIAKKLYGSLFGQPSLYGTLEGSEHDAEAVSQKITALLTQDKPCMIARFGSNELGCLVNYLGIQHGPYPLKDYLKGSCPEWWWNQGMKHCMLVNAGFFPNTEENLMRFCKLMLQDIAQLDVLGSWIKREALIADRLQDVYVAQMNLLEPFWSHTPWTKALAGKKVLVVHPFVELIESQYNDHRKELFRHPDLLPDFQLRTVKAVQSMGGEPNGFNDWFEALDWMKAEMAREPYDIALIGCGAYGFPLAAEAKRTGHQAIHLGGVLQHLFGIRGKRWENPDYGVEAWGLPYGSYSSMMNDSWVKAGDEYKPQCAQDVEDATYW